LTTDVLAELVVPESRSRSVGTRDFLFGRNRHKESDDIARQQATDDCGSAKSGAQARKGASRANCEARNSAHPARDRHAAGVILTHEHNSDLPPPDTRRWARILDSYRTPNQVRSVAGLAITALPLVTLLDSSLVHLLPRLCLGVIAYRYSSCWLSFAPVLDPARLRPWHLFHRSPGERLGRPVIGVLTLTPYDWWRRTHAIHHATTGNLDRRGIGDIDTLTVREYQARSWRGRLKYRLYRHPLVMFVVGSAYLFLLQHRLPVGLMRNGWQPWASFSLLTPSDGSGRRDPLEILSIGLFGPSSTGRPLADDAERASEAALR